MSQIITCPSGLSGRIRGMKVREERILADRKLAKIGGQVDELLSACWEETLDAGPFDFGNTTAFDRRKRGASAASPKDGTPKEAARSSSGARCSRVTASSRCCRPGP